MLDLKDTMRRLAHVGRLIDVNENSEFVKMADALFSVERKRLKDAVRSTKKTLTDWADEEIDNFWGILLGVERLHGIEKAEEYTGELGEAGNPGDGQYISRIKRFMEAANTGITLETVRKAAEAGAGVPFSITRHLGRLTLTPLETISPHQKASALRAVRRLAPARAHIEIGEPEDYSPNRPEHIFSNSVYLGESPDPISMEGPNKHSANMVVSATANQWARSVAPSLFPGTGLPNELLENGAWHTSSMGFGETAKLRLGLAETRAVNRVKLSVGPGRWGIDILVDNESVHYSEVKAENFDLFDRMFEPMKVTSTVEIHITNLAQDPEELFVKGVYVGVTVTPTNRVEWLALEQQEGSGFPEEQVVLRAEDILKGGNWFSAPQNDPLNTVDMYITFGGAPRNIEALSFKTKTPGVLFTVSYSSDTGDYDTMEWTPLQGTYKLINGRVKVAKFKAKHARITFTRLTPYRLREFEDS